MVNTIIDVILWLNIIYGVFRIFADINFVVKMEAKLGKKTRVLFCRMAVNIIHRAAFFVVYGILYVIINLIVQMIINFTWTGFVLAIAGLLLVVVIAQIVYFIAITVFGLLTFFAVLYFLPTILGGLTSLITSGLLTLFIWVIGPILAFLIYVELLKGCELFQVQSELDTLVIT